MAVTLTDTAPTGPVLSLSIEATTDAGGVFLDSSPNGASSSAATYGIWIKTAQTSQQMLFQGQGYLPFIYIQNNQIAVQWGESVTPVISADTNPIADGNWHHIMLIFNNGAISFAKDGIFTADALTIPARVEVDYRVNLGGNWGGVPGFVGEFWNAQVWSAALAPDAAFDTIANPYTSNFPSDLVLVTSFDSNANTVTNLINGHQAISMVDATVITDTLPDFVAAPTSYALTYSTKLSEDYIHSNTMDALATATQPLATFLNSSGQSEALLINTEGELCHLMREPLSSTGWNITGIAAQEAGIAAANANSLAIMGTDFSVWVSNGGHWNPVSGIGGTNLSISALADGTIFATSTPDGENYDLYQYDPVADNVVNLGDVPYATPPVGSGGNLYTLDGEGNVLYNNTNPIQPTSEQWQNIDTTDLTGWNPQSIYSTADNFQYVLCSNTDPNTGDTAYALFTQDPDDYGWSQITLPPFAVTVAPQSGNAFYALCNDNDVLSLMSCDINGNFTTVAPPTGRIINAISVGAQDGNLWGMDTFGTVWCQRNGAWVRLILPTDLSGATGGDNVTEVVTGQHALGTQYAFYILHGDLYYSSFEETAGTYGGYWTAPNSIATGISNIAVVNDPVTASNLIVYGVDSTGRLVIVQNQNGNWTPEFYKMSKPLDPTRLVFNTYNSYWLVYALIGGYMCASVGQLNKPTTGLTQLAGSPQFKTIIPASTNPRGIDWSIGALGIDNQNQLWMVQIVGANGDMFQFKFIQLSGTAIESAVGPINNAVAMYASEYDGLRIYATDQDDQLWILRLDSYSGGNFGTYTWNEWHPLGNDCQLLGTGCTIPAPSNASLPPVDLFSLDSFSEVNVLSEDPTTGALTDLVMYKPAGTNEDAEYVSRYLTEITITDNNGLNQPNYQLSVTSDIAIGIWVGQNAYLITPDSPTTLTTDSTGKLTFAFFADDLHTPTFNFAASGLSAPSIYPAQEIHDYLAGGESALPEKPRFDSTNSATTLSNAQMQTAPDWEANNTTQLVAPDYSSNASSAATTLNGVFASKPSGGTSGQWSVDSSSNDLLGGSSFWHDLCNFGHDIDHAVKKAALTVSKIEHDAVNGLIKITMALKNGLTQVLDLVINTVEDIVSAAKSIFRFIGRAVDEVIHWIKSLFAWSDVINTKKVIETVLTCGITKLQDNFNPNSPEYLGKVFDHYYQDLVADINNAFTKAEDVFAATPSISDQANSSPYPSKGAPMGSNPLAPTSMQNAQTTHSTHTNYVHTHALNYASQGGTIPAPSMISTLESLFTEIDANLNKDPYKTAHMEAISNLKSLTAKGFADVLIFDIINAIEKAVMLLLDFVQSVIDQIIALLGDALNTMLGLFTQQINIPVISYIWKKMSGNVLTMLDLSSLVVALPTTLLYKLTFGMPGLNPPYSPTVTNDIVTKYSDPTQFPWYSVASLDNAATNANAVGDSGLSGFPFLADAFVIPAVGAFYAFFDVLCDANAYSKYKEVPAPETLPASPFITALSHFNCYTALAFQLFTAPYSTMQKPPSGPADGMTLVNWAFGFLPMGVNWLFTFGESKKRIADMNNAYGLPLLTGLGVFQLAIGITTSFVQAYKDRADYNGFYWAQNVVAPIPSTLKWLLTIQGEFAQEVCSGILLGVDLDCDLANGALAFCQDWV